MSWRQLEKKTYDALAEGDHGLKEAIRKSGQKPNLSQVEMAVD